MIAKETTLLSKPSNVKPSDEDEVAQVTIQAEEMMVRYSAFQIKTQSDFDTAGEALRTIKARIAAVEDLQKSITQPLNLVLKRWRDLCRRPLDYFVRAENSLRKTRLIFQQDQEAKRLEAESKLRELARKEEEKKKKALETRAQKAEEKGDAEKAEELREKKAEVFVPAPIVESQVERTKGIGMRKDWKARIVDPQIIPRDFLCVDEKKLNQYARTMKDQARVPGVEFYFVEIEIVGKSDNDIFGKNMEGK